MTGDIIISLNRHATLGAPVKGPEFGKHLPIYVEPCNVCLDIERKSEMCKACHYLNMDLVDYEWEQDKISGDLQPIPHDGFL